MFKMLGCPHFLFFQLLLVPDGKEDNAKYKNLQNWSCAIGYGGGSGSPLSPSFNFNLELAKSSQVSVCPSLSSPMEWLRTLM